MSLLPVNQRPLKMYGPQGIAEAIVGKSKTSFYVQHPRVTTGTRLNMLNMMPTSATWGSQANDTNSNALEGFIVGTNRPYLFSNGLNTTNEFDGPTTLSTLWPNFRCHGLKVHFNITLGKLDNQISGRYVFAYRWLRDDDESLETIDQREIKEDPTWTRVPLKHVDSAQSVDSREASNAREYNINCYTTWKFVYPFESDDSWTEQRIDLEKDSITLDGLPKKPIILQYNIFNTDVAQVWTANTVAFMKIYTTIYYEMDRYTGANAFIED